MLGGELFCCMCGTRPEDIYGVRCDEFIELHHLDPIRNIEGRGRLVELTLAYKQFAPLCPNCHRMLELYNLSLDELKQMIEEKRETDVVIG